MLKVREEGISEGLEDLAKQCFKILMALKRWLRLKTMNFSDPNLQSQVIFSCNAQSPSLI